VTPRKEAVTAVAGQRGAAGQGEPAPEPAREQEAARQREPAEPSGRARHGAHGRREASRRRTVILAAAGAVAVALIVTVLVVVTGSRHLPTPAALDGSATGSTPIPVLYSQAEGWHGGQVKPGQIYLGQGGAPFARGLAWSRWTAAGAQAHGTVYVQKPGCTGPSYQCAYQRFPHATVTVSRPGTHDGVRYWSRMTWSYPQDMTQRVISWQFRNGLWRA